MSPPPVLQPPRHSATGEVSGLAGPVPDPIIPLMPPLPPEPAAAAEGAAAIGGGPGAAGGVGGVGGGALAAAGAAAGGRLPYFSAAASLRLVESLRQLKGLKVGG